MKKNVIKIATILIIALLLLNITNVVMAISTDITPIATSVDSKITNIAGQILQIVQIVGVAVAVIMLTVVGIKYITASPSEKAEYKKSLTIYVVGAFLLFGASFLMGILRNFITTAVS